MQRFSNSFARNPRTIFIHFVTPFQIHAIYNNQASNLYMVWNGAALIVIT